MNITEIEWQCRHCQTNHLDDYARASFVTCPDCGRIYQWDDILSIGEISDMELSIFLRELDEKDYLYTMNETLREKLARSIKIANKMIADMEKLKSKAIDKEDWRRAGDLSSYIDGMKQTLVIFELLQDKDTA